MNSDKMPRQNKTYIIIKQPIPQGTEIRIHYENGNVIVTDNNDHPYDIYSQSMERYYVGKNKPKVMVAKAINLPYMTNEVGSWVTNFD